MTNLIRVHRQSGCNILKENTGTLIYFRSSFFEICVNQNENKISAILTFLQIRINQDEKMYLNTGKTQKDEKGRGQIYSMPHTRQCQLSPETPPKTPLPSMKYACQKLISNKKYVNSKAANLNRALQRDLINRQQQKLVWRKRT